MTEENDLGSNQPPCKVLVRSKEGVEVYEIPSHGGADPPSPPSVGQRPFLCKGATNIPLLPSPDGSHVYINVASKGILKCPIPDSLSSLSTTSQTSAPFFAGTQGVQMMDVSPSGAFLLTWERWNETTCPNNLKVWRTSTGKCVAAFTQRNVKRDVWPYVQWTHDELFAVLLATNEVRFYPVENLMEIEKDAQEPSSVRFSDKLRIQGVSSISVPQKSTLEQNGTYLLTAFVPGTKDKPARAGMYQFTPGSSKPDSSPLLSKSLFQAEDMKVHWSPIGDAALLTLQTAVDTSGQSYYGSSQLFLMKQGESDVVAVPLPQEGPVLNVGWLPDPTKPPCFVVVAGKMPSLASLHHGKTGKPTFVFGNAHRNVISWSPHGRFLCLAGFGNLAGGMSFWDRNKQKLINNGCAENASGSLRSNKPVVGYDWSPSSRWFLCSTCSPRMNVENGIQLLRYNGQSVSSVPWNNDHYAPDKLLQACFVPAKPSVYPDRPQSPPPSGTEGSTDPSSTSIAAASGASSAAPPTTKPAGRYVPPSARNRPGGTSLADRLRQEKEGSIQAAGKVSSNNTTIKTLQGERAVVGMAQPSKSKSALKREKEKKKKQQQQQQEEQQEEQQKDHGQQPQQQAPSTLDPEKQARKIKKTLKQIDELKQKDAESLNEDQKAKISLESELRAQLQQLGF